MCSPAVMPMVTGGKMTVAASPPAMTTAPPEVLTVTAGKVTLAARRAGNTAAEPGGPTVTGGKTALPARPPAMTTTPPADLKQAINPQPSAAVSADQFPASLGVTPDAGPAVM